MACGLREEDIKGAGMTYLLFVNGVYFQSTRNCQLAFQLLHDWEASGQSSGLRFVRDNDKEALKWLVPPEVLKELAA